MQLPPLGVRLIGANIILLLWEAYDVPDSEHFVNYPYNIPNRFILLLLPNHFTDEQTEAKEIYPALHKY